MGSQVRSSGTQSWAAGAKAQRCAQVDGCQKDLSKEKEYYQRYRICEDHLKLGSLIKDGIQQRFCQQCGRFHVLADFDADKRYAPLGRHFMPMHPGADNPGASL